MKLFLASLLTATVLAGGFAADPVPEPWFVESAQAVGLDFVHFNGMSGKLYFPEHMGGGIAWIDFDEDGDLDLYVGQGTFFGDESAADAVFPPRHPEPLTDRFYRNDRIRPDGGEGPLRFVDVTSGAGLEVATGYSMGVATGDYDGDGLVDLYITNLGSNQLLRNRGDGTFEDRTAPAGADDRRWSVPASFFDADADGDLDLFVGNYVEFRLANHKRCAAPNGAVDYCGPLAYPAEGNRLLENRGDGTFEDATPRWLPGAVPGTTLGSGVADIDGDGRLDLYVANDMMNNELWLAQETGGFLDDALMAGAAVNEDGLPEASMGVVSQDFDGDGSIDLFMTHLQRETNTLYLNDGTGFFVDSSKSSGLGGPSFPYTGFGTVLADLDVDGHLDLFVVNGAVRREDAQLREGDLHPLQQPNQLFRGVGPARFEVVDAAVSGDPFEEVSRGLAGGDVDNDGDLDLLVSNNGGRLRLLLNQADPERWVGVRLRVGELDAYGAKVRWRSGDRTGPWRVVQTDGSYVSAHDPRVLLYPPEGSFVVEVRWPRGPAETFPSVALGAYTEIRRGAS